MANISCVNHLFMHLKPHQYSIRLGGVAVRACWWYRIFRSFARSLARSLPVWSPCLSISLLSEQDWPKKKKEAFIFFYWEEKSSGPRPLLMTLKCLPKPRHWSWQDKMVFCLLCFFDVWWSPTLTGSDVLNWQGQKNPIGPGKGGCWGLTLWPLCAP